MIFFVVDRTTTLKRSKKMKKFFLVLALTMFSTSSFASMEFRCTGENEAETLQFAASDVEGIQIDQVSPALCGNYTSIDPEAGDEGAWLSIDVNRKPTARTVKYDLWDGNWGWVLSVPSEIADGEGLDSFTIGYRFDYNDIDQITIRRKLDCVRID